MSTLARLVAVACVLAISGCGFVDDETLVGPYKLVAVDVREDMSLCWQSLDGKVCEGIVGPTLFAAGFNDDYVVAAVHPSVFPKPPNKSVTQYYYVIRDRRNEGKDFGPPPKNVKGPFNARDYATERARLHLPDLVHVFDDLK
ncbi:MAG TPA: hypothetical protein VNU97_11955 [Rhizomicrobium sp.]|jgi:hypothetical protein|nr:hypothetical protein [Rhizomicrobium sp.]